MKALVRAVLPAVAFALAAGGSGCSSSPKVQKQAYAPLKSTRVFEHEMPMVWKAIEEALRGQKIVERDPEEVSEVELRKLGQREVETDWVLSLSRDRYIEFKVNGFPRKQYLQNRFRHHVTARKVLGGIEVQVGTDEEIERLGADGSPQGWDGLDEPDSSRPSELLEKIQLALLSATP